ncbi:MAG: hypothetical protein HW412_1286, partial [Bacteroidetes bacterium]|nr:hypothetical protein [Bacteroidota bacterium]
MCLIQRGARCTGAVLFQFLMKGITAQLDTASHPLVHYTIHKQGVTTMKPVFVFVRQFCLWLLLLFVLQPLQAQQVLEKIDDPHSQADYIIISPPSYTSTMQQLSTHRSTHSHLRVAIVTTDAIYQIFGQGVRADSAIRAFVTFTLTSWSDPKPQYFLLAGNVNTVPSHKEQSLFPESEDSIMVDQWFVEGLPPYNVPAAALGRFPAWDQTQLQTMVGKTIDYET